VLLVFSDLSNTVWLRQNGIHLTYPFYFFFWIRDGKLLYLLKYIKQTMCHFQIYIRVAETSKYTYE